MASAKEKVKRGKLSILRTNREGIVKSFDGTRLSYQSTGRGKPPVVCCNGLGVGTFFWGYLEEALRSSHQFVTWDYRGHGRSELKQNPKQFTLDALVKDGKAVFDTLKLKKAILVGHSLGVQTILEFYRRWPERVAAMVFCFGTYGHPMDYFYNMRLSRYLFQIAHLLGTAFPKQGNLISHFLLKNPLSFWMGGLFKIMHTGMVNRKDTDRYVDHLLHVDPFFFTTLLKSAQDHTAEDILHKIKVPTLIIAGEFDQFTPMWISKKMNRLIPNSELFVIHKATHAGLVEQPDLINLRIEKFIRERVSPR